MLLVKGLLSALALLVSACGGDEADAVYARLRNATEFDFTQVQLGFTLAFGPLPAGATSEYRAAGESLLYAVDGGAAETAELLFFGPVTDHAGGAPLGNGHYTFEVGAAVISPYIDGYDGPVFFSAQ